MTWLVLIALVAVVFVVLVLNLRAKRIGWEAIAAALLVGLAGYAMQGHPYTPGAPKAAREKSTDTAAAAVQERQQLAGMDTTGNKWVMIGDALARQGQYADAATILRGAVDADPKNSDAWLAMANALVGHAEGNLSPAALYAFRHAAAADPQAPGPPFFLGMAMARAGRFDDARALWAGLLMRTPAKAPWRDDLVMRLGRLDKLMAMIRQSQAAGDGAGDGMVPPPR